jgi:hypothetical protein
VYGRVFSLLVLAFTLSSAGYAQSADSPPAPPVAVSFLASNASATNGERAAFPAARKAAPFSRLHRDNGYQVTLGYGNWGRYNGGQMRVAAPLLRTNPLVVQGMLEFGGYRAQVQVDLFNPLNSHRSYATVGLGAQAQLRFRRSYLLGGGGVYHTRYLVPMPEDVDDIQLSHRTGLGYRFGVGYMTGKNIIFELSASHIPRPDTGDRRRLIFSLDAGVRF